MSELETLPCRDNVFVFRRRKRRRRESLPLRRRRWSSSSAALASAVALLLLPCVYNSPAGTGTVAHEEDAVREPETELWLDAQDYEDLSPLPLLAKKREPPVDDRTMEEELQLRAENQRKSQQRVDQERDINEREQREYKQFMDWCQKVLGIQTTLEIHTFYYYDYMTASMMYQESQDAGDNDDDDDYNVQTDLDAPKNSSKEEWQDPPLIPVRGLMATRSIAQGEVIISIPFQALLTVSTTIDQDPVLSRVMGKEARRVHGWYLGQDNIDDSVPSGSADTADFFELPLLAMALLHHYKLGTSSPLYPYIHLLRKSPTKQMPFLWSKQKRQELYNTKLSSSSSLAKGIQTVARSIRLEMKDMYQTVVETLVKNHPDLFGRRNAGQAQQYDTLDDEDWAFSFENFQWAFAMVNSRHWLLPIKDLEESQLRSESPPAATPMRMQPQGIVDGVPPADMPTEAWLKQQEKEENHAKKSHEVLSPAPRNTPSAYHSFLAPVADLLNFGPPCTRGRYNQDTHTFDIIASCNFTPGQEITFWYGDECEEIIIGNYGFTHPMVPKSPTVEEFRLARDKWKQKANSLQDALEDAYEDMDVMDTELQNVQQILAECDCCNTARRATDGAHQGYEIPTEQPSQKQEQRKPWRLQQGNVDGLHGTYLRNPHDHDPAPSQIRGGGGTMMSRSSSSRVNASARGTDGQSRTRNDNVSPSGRQGDHGNRRSPRGRVNSDDDVERHGVRRMWAVRSAL